MYFPWWKWPFSSRSPPSMKKHSGAMHSLYWKWPFSSRSPPSLICYLKTKNVSIFKALIKKNTPTIRLSTGRNAFPLMKMVIFFKIAPTFYKRISFYKRIYNRKYFYKLIFYRAQGISLTENSHFLQDRPHPFIKGNPFIKEFIIRNTFIKGFSTGHKAFPLLKMAIFFKIAPTFL